MIRSTERIAAADVLRGFALLGILLVNMRYFSSPALYDDGVKGSDFDRVFVAVVDVLFEASAYPLFAFLFGFGAMTMFRRISSRGKRPIPILLRRFFLLLGIGMAHAFGLWFGDILIPYAVAGFIMFFLFAAPPHWWRTAAVAVFLLFHGLMVLLMALSMWTGGTKPVGGHEAEAAAAVRHYQSGTFGDVFWQRWNDWMYINGDGGLLLTVLTVLPFCLLGGYAADQRWLEADRHSPAKLRRLMRWALCFGLALKTIPYWAGVNDLTMYIQNSFGGAALAVFYAAAAVFICGKRSWQRAWRWWQDVGKMSLTHYLAQSLVCTSLFYGYGLGWYGRTSAWQEMLIAFALYATQVWISRFWFARFHYGPVEWMWRWGTYGTRPPFRRRPGQ
ncbi:DUF418 domain-containing protein [Geobacillus stearothermophilus]|uniref:DUF418 domain-containing protein n=1 Tax=Geobacillus stearothermophilus TaxID=1422 RepID=UPI002402B14D|nr:DUF418 domain-containing protein [Geobacillus stearothermophilus]MDF9296921.1 DUF418 domain-containing protein [Geobacillus stearothermophilus]WJQ11254.1 DUF418 domain-containing protein [Geobacillus stearothermophilus]